MKKARFLALMTAGLISGSLLAPTTASAGSICNNGTYSMNSGRGTCSWNGGVNNRFPSFSDPGSSSWNRQNGFRDPFKSSGSSWNRQNGFRDPFKSSGSSWNRQNGFRDPFSSSKRSGFRW